MLKLGLIFQIFLTINGQFIFLDNKIKIVDLIVKNVRTGAIAFMYPFFTLSFTRMTQQTRIR